MKKLNQTSIQQIAQWLANNDTGRSSETMAVIAMGATETDTTRFDAPHDPSDFGRCYRLVEATPQVREFFKVIGKMVPTFAGILNEWDALVEIYLRDLASGKSEQLYRRIKELRGDCPDHPILKKAPV